MKLGRLIVLLLVFTNIFANVSSAKNLNNLKNMFLTNNAIIYTINIRTFGAKDNDGDEIIDIYKGDEKGTFLNAANRLEEIKNLGFNTIYLLPITKTGKLKALGTAGSLYAMDSFTELNPQFDDKNDERTVDEEAKFFIDKAHKLNMKVIVDMPCAGSYDMSLEKKELFFKDKNGKNIVPSDWTDIRLFKIYDGKKLNNDILEGYKAFVDKMQNLGIDGIRADVAGIKPKEFWLNLINYAKQKDPGFLFLAEANPSWKNPVRAQNFYTTVPELLNAGFDGYYGEYGDYKNIVNAKEFNKKIANEQKIIRKYDAATISAFVTHDEQSPTLFGDDKKSEMIIWLSTTLKTNPYFLDGFTTGDSYTYKYENKKASYSTTDDDYYFVHKGKMDIFNFSRPPMGNYPNLLNETKHALEFRNLINNNLADIKTLNSHNQSVFAYKRVGKDGFILVIGNLDNKNSQKAKIKIKKMRENIYILPIKTKSEPGLKGKSLSVELSPLEIQVYLIQNKN